MNGMSFMLVVPYYAVWHYTEALGNIMRIWFNYLWFFYNVFSIPVLLKTLFAPWKRLQEEYKGGLDLENWASTKIINIMMRLVGAMVRLMFIIVGLGILALTFAVGVIFFFVWVFMPFVMGALLIWGFGLLLI